MTLVVVLLMLRFTDQRGLFRVKATNGDTHLGGDDFDLAIINWMPEVCKRRIVEFYQLQK